MTSSPLAAALRPGPRRGTSSGLLRWGAVRSTRVSPAAFAWIASLAVVCFALLVATGGAVRLTGSGLGCPDWPSCYAHRFTAAASFHPIVEFSNRVVTVAVTVVSAVAFVAAWRREPVRRDLVVLSGGLVAGIVAQIVLGGLVVLFRLNPYLVALHFLLTFAVLGDALVLAHLARSPRTPREPLVGRDLLWLSRLELGTFALLVTIGTVVTGAGPHAGGPGAKRIDVAFRDIAELHSTVALFLIGGVLATLFALHQAGAPAPVQRRARRLLEVLALQGALGYMQYFLHDAATVVELHLIGATIAWCAFVGYYLSLHRHPATAPAAGLGAEEPAALLRPVAGVRAP